MTWNWDLAYTACLLFYTKLHFHLHIHRACELRDGDDNLRSIAEIWNPKPILSRATFLPYSHATLQLLRFYNSIRLQPERFAPLSGSFCDSVTRRLHFRRRRVSRFQSQCATHCTRAQARDDCFDTALAEQRTVPDCKATRPDITVTKKPPRRHTNFNRTGYASFRTATCRQLRRAAQRGRLHPIRHAPLSREVALALSHRSRNTCEMRCKHDERRTHPRHCRPRCEHLLRRPPSVQRSKQRAPRQISLPSLHFLKSKQRPSLQYADEDRAKVDRHVPRPTAS